MASIGFPSARALGLVYEAKFAYLAACIFMCKLLENIKIS